MKNQLEVSEFIIDGKPTDVGIIDKIVKYHMNPINRINNTLVVQIRVSSKSGFRTFKWEISKGRPGTSQHCFGENSEGVIDPNELGAVDYTWDNFQKFKEFILSRLIKETDYTRFCVYNTFIHADYRTTKTGKRQLFKAGSDGDWDFVKNID